ncbi:MAG: hypothetical protein HOV87_12925 [Catenulispora sp.]|nr:hypothetical protein [Catenulispora sp.]
MNQTEPAYRDDDEQGPPRSEEELDEMRERTAETVAEARREVDRAVATSHDQLLPAAESGVVGDYEAEEGVPTKDDTRGAWPDWAKESSKHSGKHSGKHSTEQPSEPPPEPPASEPPTESPTEAPTDPD